MTTYSNMKLRTINVNRNLWLQTLDVRL